MENQPQFDIDIDKPQFFIDSSICYDIIPFGARDPCFTLYVKSLMFAITVVSCFDCRCVVFAGVAREARSGIALVALRGEIITFRFPPIKQ